MSGSLHWAPWTLAHQTPLSVKFSRQEYGSGLSFPSPMTIPDPGIKPLEPYSHALASRVFNTSTTWEALKLLSVCLCSVAQSCSILCDSMDYSPPGSSVHGILQAKILSNLPLLLQGIDCPDPGVKPASPVPSALAVRFLNHWETWEACLY